MLRLHFTVEDLLRVRLAANPAPMVELSLGVAGIRRLEPNPGIAAWHASLDRRLPRASRALFDLIRPSGSGPLFLDPFCATFEEGLELVRSTRVDDLTADLQIALGPHRTPGPVGARSGWS